MKYYCQKCQKLLSDKEFYTYQNKEKVELCKKCLTMHVDPFNPETFLWILEKLDVPYAEEEWNVLRDRAYSENPARASGLSITGKYLSKMKLIQWKDKRWADSEHLQPEEEEGDGKGKKLSKKEQKKKEKEAYNKKLQEDLDNGNITESQYKTLADAQYQYEKHVAEAPMRNPAFVGYENPYDENKFAIKEDDLPNPEDELTRDDKIYLAMKWGRLYTPRQWIGLEKKYAEMEKSFDIQDSDSISTLILICKTYLKMNDAIDKGDLQGYQQLSRVYDQMRKSANFTAVQNKDDREDFVDSVGNLVAYCEKAGGAIPRLKFEVNYDIVDKVIADLKDYNKSLIYEDSSLARQIEDYLKRREAMETDKHEKIKAKREGREFTLTDDDIHDYTDMMQKQKEHDSKIGDEEI